MRKSSVELTFDNFTGWLKWYDDFLAKIYMSRRVVRTFQEKLEIFEAFVLRIDAIWGIFVEQLLIDCLNRDTSQYARHTGTALPKHLPKEQCMAMLLGLGYLDFRSIGEIKKIGRDVLVDVNNPFKGIPQSAGSKIDEFYKIRNYVAHYSSLSKRSLMKVYKEKYGMKRFREPGDFLMAQDRKSGQIRFSNYVDAFIEVAYNMGLFLGVYK